jgi:hypothetical protein
LSDDPSHAFEPKPAMPADRRLRARAVADPAIVEPDLLVDATIVAGDYLAVAGFGGFEKIEQSLWPKARLVGLSITVIAADGRRLSFTTPAAWAPPNEAGAV